MKKAIQTRHLVQVTNVRTEKNSAKELIQKLQMVIDISTYFVNYQCQNSGDKVLH